LEYSELKNRQVTLPNFILRLCFGHKRSKKEKSAGGYRGQSKETGSVSENLDDEPKKTLLAPAPSPVDKATRP
jgi:hypothetical protein